MFAQELARLRSETRMLDEIHAQVTERDVIQQGRPEGCSCLGTGGLGNLLAVMQDETALFVRYCACPEGLVLEEMAGWVNAGIDVAEEQERSQLEAQHRGALEREILERAGIDQRYMVCTFDSFRQLLIRRHLMRPTIERHLEAMEASYGSGEPLRGDFIYGPPGHGKTSLSVSAQRAWMARGRAALFMPYSRLVDGLSMSYARRDDTGEKLLERMRHVPLLVLDDLLMVPASAYVRGRVAGVLLERHAAGNRLLTIITSNHPIQEAAQLLAIAPDTGGVAQQQASGRLEGRIREMCDELKLETADLRTGLREHVVN